MTKLRLIIVFFKSFALASCIITLICISIIYAWGIETIAALIWFNIITDVLILYFINIYKQKELYYYHNLGLSKSFLWIASLAIDFILFVLLIILTLMIK